MSDDLISRSTLLEDLKNLRITITGSNVTALMIANETKKSIMRMVEEQPTAYDVDKVIDSLGRERNFLLDENGHCYSAREFISIDKAIEIVKYGGASND